MNTDHKPGPPRLPALRHRDFRLLWVGELLSSIGSQMQLIAVNWHVYTLLQGQHYNVALFHWHIALNAQPLGLGILGAVRVVPIFVFALLGGLVADRYNRRRLILWTQLIAVITTGSLALITLSGHITVFWLYLFTAFDIAISAFSEPAQNAFFPELVPDEHLANASTLYALLWQIGTIAGPALASVMIAITKQIGLVYLVNAGSFALVFVAVVLIQHRSTIRLETEAVSWGMLRDGLRFVSRSRIIWSTMLLDFFATFFGTARTMLPFVADQILHIGVTGYGLLALAQPVGAMLTGIFLAFSRHIPRQGLLLLVSVVVYGLATALFGVTTLFALSFLFFALTGVGDTVSTIIRSIIRQEKTPDALRGRVNGVHMMLAFGGPQLGEVESGLLAAFLGIPFAICSGGIATVLLVAWVAWKYPDLRRYAP